MVGSKLQVSKLGKKVSDAQDNIIQQLLSIYQAENYVSVEEMHKFIKKKLQDARASKDMVRISLQELRGSISMEYFSVSNMPEGFEELSQRSSQATNADITEVDSAHSLHSDDVDKKKKNSCVSTNYRNSESENRDHQYLYLKETDLETLNNWNFDITEITDEKEKIRLTWAMFHLTDIFNYLNVSKDIFYNFLSQVYEKYQSHSNPFHNFNHGFTVTHSMFYFLQNKVLEDELEFADKVILMISCIGHDLDHTGRTNAFECSVMSELALKYNDESVLENHHVSTLFHVLQENCSNIFQNIPKDEFKMIRRLIISNILHTDMKRHFEILQKIETKIQAIQDDENVIIIKDESDKKIILGFLVHACDLSGPARQFSIAKSWSLNISKEFTNQVTEEEELGIPVTPYLIGLTNLEKISREEVKFIAAIVKPIWEALQNLDKNMSFTVDNLNSNIEKWNQVNEEEVQKEQQQQFK